MNNKGSIGAFGWIIVALLLAVAGAVVYFGISSGPLSFEGLGCTREPITIDGETFSSVNSLQTKLGLDGDQITEYVSMFNVELQDGTLTGCLPEPEVVS